MRIVKDRSRGCAELLLAGCLKALVQLPALVFCVLPDFAGNDRNLVMTARNAADTRGPAHLLKIIPAGFFGFELLIYVYQIHFLASVYLCKTLNRSILKPEYKIIFSVSRG